MAASFLEKPYALTSNYFGDVNNRLALSKPVRLESFFDADYEGSSALVIKPTGFDSSVISTPTLKYNQNTQPIGFGSTLYGALSIRLRNKYVDLNEQAIYSFLAGTLVINNFNQQVTVGYIDSLQAGIPLIYNLKQFAPLQGKDQSSYGIAYLQGGVKLLSPTGCYATLFGLPATADQYVNLTGIDSLLISEPDVSPQIIHTTGIATSYIGLPNIRDPAIKTIGLVHGFYGKATVWFHTRPLAVIGFESYATGYPKVFDPTQFVQPSAFNRTAVFGDTYAKNVWTFIRGAGAIDDSVVSQWLVIENTGRPLKAIGFVSQSFGSQLVRNKSPSIFFGGLPAPTFSAPSIGYVVRAISPTGFDHLGLGKLTVIKTPELLPNGLDATQFGTQWVSNYTRYIHNNSNDHSNDHSNTGTPTIWFRFRYAYPDSWQSSRFGDGSTVTHGVREIIGQGFIQQGYGNAWVSRGVRLLELLSIFKNQQASNHFVGRHQEIKSVGFIATRFGERIIPDIQALYPQGFTGVFGQAATYLHTQYLKPKGYLSAGDQPAFRWGRQIFYNSVQYITQNFAGDNGLVPPTWSQWQSIENRNKTIGAIGTAMQKFGYAQIDNHARLLELKGILATKFSPSMIACRIRRLPIQGIEAPYMAGWHIIHNAARVIAPTGSVQTLVGYSSPINTRRYYERVGRIESQEFGTPMIADRIRKIEVEKRYSIAPPLIRLPTVDLYTRYIDLRGYETAKYGLASLSIHFKIITPRWDHREKSGYPALRNVTPELLTKGHDSQEYGSASIRTQWREVYAQGDNASLFGLTHISDSKQNIVVAGSTTSAISQKHVVTKTASAPYSPQYIYLNDENSSQEGEGFGIEPPSLSKPYLNQNVLYHRGYKSSVFGDAFVWTNNLVIEGGISINGVSSGAKVINKKTIVSLDKKGIDNRIEVGRPRLSPHTIYSIVEAPEQAKLNHPVSNLHRVGEIDYGHASSRFGSPFVESSIRHLYPTWSLPSSYGRVGSPRLTLTKVIIRPEGIRLGRFGVPIIPFTPQDIQIRNGIFINMVGSNEVTRPPYKGPQTIDLTSIYSTVFGKMYAENYIRTLNVYGSESLLMGLSKYNDTPFMWQGLRVGEAVPLIIGGDDMSSIGETTIWHKVREVGMQGFDAFRSEYDITNFYGRLLVKNSDKKLLQENIIKPIAIQSNSVIGYQDIKLGQHFIRPDGNSDQFRKGGYHA